MLPRARAVRPDEARARPGRTWRPRRCRLRADVHGDMPGLRRRIHSAELPRPLLLRPVPGHGTRGDGARETLTQLAPPLPRIIERVTDQRRRRPRPILQRPRMTGRQTTTQRRPRRHRRAARIPRPGELARHLDVLSLHTALDVDEHRARAPVAIELASVAMYQRPQMINLSLQRQRPPQTHRPTIITSRPRPRQPHRTCTTRRNSASSASSRAISSGSSTTSASTTSSSDTGAPAPP
jgi:hypothetical protein